MASPQPPSSRKPSRPHTEWTGHLKAGPGTLGKLSAEALSLRSCALGLFPHTRPVVLWSWVPVRGQGETIGRTSGPLGRKEPRSLEVGKDWASFLPCDSPTPLFYSDRPTEGSRGQGWKTNSSRFSPKLVRSLWWPQANPFSPRSSFSPFVGQGAHSLRHAPPRGSFVEFSNEMQGSRRDWWFPPGAGFM